MHGNCLFFCKVNHFFIDMTLCSKKFCIFAKKIQEIE